MELIIPEWRSKRARCIKCELQRKTCSLIRVGKFPVPHYQGTTPQAPDLAPVLGAQKRKKAKIYSGFPDNRR